MCVRDGEEKGEVLKTWYSVRNEAAHGLCSRVPSVAWLFRFGRAGEGKAPRTTPLLDSSVCVSPIAVQSIVVIWHDNEKKRKRKERLHKQQKSSSHQLRKRGHLGRKPPHQIKKNAVSEDQEGCGQSSQQTSAD